MSRLCLAAFSLLVVGSALSWVVGLVPELRREPAQTLARLATRASGAAWDGVEKG